MTKEMFHKLRKDFRIQILLFLNAGNISCAIFSYVSHRDTAAILKKTQLLTIQMKYACEHPDQIKSAAWRN